LVKNAFEAYSKNIPQSIELIDASLKLLGSVIYGVSFDIKLQYAAEVPWEELSFLTLLVSKAEVGANKGVMDFYLHHVVNFVGYADDLNKNLARIIRIKVGLNDRNRTNQNLQGNERQTNQFMDGVYNFISPIMDQQILEKMVEVGTNTSGFNIRTTEGRIAVLSSIKLLGELSKYGAQFRHLHPAVRKLFPNQQSWKTLTSVRDDIAKAVSRSNTRDSYRSLIKDGNDSLFSSLKAEIKSFGQDASQALSSLNGLINGKQYDGIKELYKPVKETFPFSDPLQDILAKDMELYFNSITSKKKKKKKETLKNEIAKEVAAGEIDAMTNEKILDFFSNPPPAVQLLNGKQKHWKEQFETLSGETVMPAVIDLRLRLNNGPDGVNIDYRSFSRDLIDEISSIIVNNLEVVDAIDAVKNIDELDKPSQITLSKQMELFLSSQEKRMAVSQLMADLYLCLKKVSPGYGIKPNRILRNAMEHLHPMFHVPAESQQNQCIFFEALGYISKAKKQLNTPLDVNTPERTEMNRAANKAAGAILINAEGCGYLAI